MTVVVKHLSLLTGNSTVRVVQSVQEGSRNRTESLVNIQSEYLPPHGVRHTVFVKGVRGII